MALSILPDTDILIPRLTHRGATHSLIIIILASTPFLIRYGIRTIPYLLAVAQHAFLGDYLLGGSELLWPITRTTYGIDWSLYGWQSLILEWGAFLVSAAVMLKTRDIATLLKPEKANLLLFLPATAGFASLFLQMQQPLPQSLIVPELAFLALYILSITSPLTRPARLMHILRSKMSGRPQR
jgi:membrane-bound metal-dependent hydrolase YbcI (DUF457 family)